MSGSPATPGKPPSETGAIARKGGWVLASRFVAQAAQFLIVLVAARIMGPAEFGLFALVFAFALGLTRLAEAGWREYVMGADTLQAASLANTLALASGLSALAIGCLVAAGLVLLGHEPAIAGMVALMAGWVLLTTLTATQAGYLVRNGRFAALSLAQIAGELLGLAVAVAMMLSGKGIMALVTGKLATQAIVLSACFAATRWFPLSRWEPVAGRAAVSFSGNILATRLVGYLYEAGPVFAIGSLIGPAGAGLFRGAGRLSAALSEVVGDPVRLLAWSVLKKPDSGPQIDRLIGLALIFATPLFLGLAMTAQSVIALLLGPQWAEAAPLLTAFAIAGWVNTLNVMTEPLLATRGRVALVPRLSIAFTLLQLALMVGMAPFGLLWIAVGQLLSSLIILPVVVAVQVRIGGASLGRLARQAIACLMAAGAMVLAISIIRHFMPDTAPVGVRLAIEIVIGAISYTAAIGFLTWRGLARIEIQAPPRSGMLPE